MNEYVDGKVKYEKYKIREGNGRNGRTKDNAHYVADRTEVLRMGRQDRTEGSKQVHLPLSRAA